MINKVSLQLLLWVSGESSPKSERLLYLGLVSRTVLTLSVVVTCALHVLVAVLGRYLRQRRSWKMVQFIWALKACLVEWAGCSLTLPQLICLLFQLLSRIFLLTWHQNHFSLLNPVPLLRRVEPWILAGIWSVSGISYSPACQKWEQCRSLPSEESHTFHDVTES